MVVETSEVNSSELYHHMLKFIWFYLHFFCFCYNFSILFYVFFFYYETVTVIQFDFFGRCAFIVLNLGNVF